MMQFAELRRKAVGCVKTASLSISGPSVLIEANQSRATTIVGMAVAFAAVPLYIVLRWYWGTIGLASAISISITVYALLLGFLQRRRFEREATKRGTTLHDGPGMLNAAPRPAAAAGRSASGSSCGPRSCRLLPGAGLTARDRGPRRDALRGRGGIYLALAQSFGIHELVTLERMLLRRLKLRRPTLSHVRDEPSH